MAVCVSAAVIQNSAAISDAQDLEGAESANPQFFGGYGGGYGGYGGYGGGYGGYGKKIEAFELKLINFYRKSKKIDTLPIE